VNFFIIAPYKYTYLLTDQFLVDNYLWQFYGITSKPGGRKYFFQTRWCENFLSQDLECPKSNLMKAYNTENMTIAATLTDVGVVVNVAVVSPGF